MCKKNKKYCIELLDFDNRVIFVCDDIVTFSISEGSFFCCTSDDFTHRCPMSLVKRIVIEVE